MLTRRAFLRTGTAAGATLASFAPEGLTRIAHAAAAVNGVASDAVAKDEDFWREIQLAFTLDRSMINLNNGGVCPRPRIVQEASSGISTSRIWRRTITCGRCSSPASKRCADRSRARSAAIPRRSPSRATPARRCRSAAWPGPQARGDEIVTTNQDYPRMLDTWRQRERRDGIVDNHQDLVPRSAAVTGCHRREFERAITPKTKVVHICHITNLTGRSSR